MEHYVLVNWSLSNGALCTCQLKSKIFVLIRLCWPWQSVVIHHQFDLVLTPNYGCQLPGVELSTSDMFYLVMLCWPSLWVLLASGWPWQRVYFWQTRFVRVAVGTEGNKKTCLRLQRGSPLVAYRAQECLDFPFTVSRLKLSSCHSWCSKLEASLPFFSPKEAKALSAI
jgi:hypothetical protein